MKHAKHPALPAAAALAAALLLAACAPAQDGPPQAPEYPWTDRYEQTLAALNEAGADYEVADDAATGASVTMESGELFGVPVQDLYLRFDTNGTLEGVRGVVAPEQTDAMQAAMRKALGDPVDSYCPASYSALEEAQGAGRPRGQLLPGQLQRAGGVRRPPFHRLGIAGRPVLA